MKKHKFKITRDRDDCYCFYKKGWFLWTLVACSLDYDRALKKIEYLKYVEYR